MKFSSTVPFAAAFNAIIVSGIPTALDDNSAPLSERAKTLWTPKLGDTWNYLTGVDGLTVDIATASKAAVVDIDLFENSAAVIAGIQAKGVKVICYFSGGSYEPDRPDSSQFNSSDLGDTLDGWPREKWLDIRTANVQTIMKARVQLASTKGCDGIEPDNVDGYGNKNGLGLTQQNSIDFVTLLATKAASLQLAIGLKNAGDLIPSLISKVQYAVNEQCANFTECDVWKPFVEAKKPVFHVEYPSNVPNIARSQVSQYCVTSFSTILKNEDVGAPTQYCPDGSQVVTAATSGK